VNASQVLGVPKTVGFSIPGCEPEPEPLGTENVAPSTILVIPRGQGKSITHLCRKIVLDPGGRLYQAGIGEFQRDLSYLKLCPPMMMSRFTPLLSHLYTQSSLLMTSFIAGRFTVVVVKITPLHTVL
jgi:hypothetical protein